MNTQFVQFVAWRMQFTKGVRKHFHLEKTSVHCTHFVQNDLILLGQNFRITLSTILDTLTNVKISLKFEK